MRVKLVVLSLVLSLSSVTFAWGFFGTSAKDVESLFIEKWHGSGVLDMKSVSAAKMVKKDIWKVTYTESYYVNEEKKLFCHWFRNKRYSLCRDAVLFVAESKECGNAREAEVEACSGNQFAVGFCTQG